MNFILKGAWRRYGSVTSRENKLSETSSIFDLSCLILLCANALLEKGINSLYTVLHQYDVLYTYSTDVQKSYSFTTLTHRTGIHERSIPLHSVQTQVLYARVCTYT